MSGTPASKSVGREVESESPQVAIMRMRFEGASPEVKAVAERELPGKVNYLRGNDPERWQREVPTFAGIRLEGLYEGIDAVFYGTEAVLEYDLVVHPGADPSLVRIAFEGQESARVTSDGDLVLGAGGGELRHRRASVYQHSPAGKRSVSARYNLDADGSIRISLGEYDRSQPLVIDPSIEWSTFVGGADSYDEATAVAVDSAGQAVVCGVTNAFDFPTTAGAFSSTFLGGPEAEYRAIIVSKLTADGSALVFSTYLDGSDHDVANDVAVAPDGSIVVVGFTSSVDFPISPTAFDSTIFQSGPDGFITRLSPTGSAIVASTFLGGESQDVIEGIVVAADSSLYVTGSTQSVDFPTTPGAFDQTLDVTHPFTDAFFTRLDPMCSTVLLSSYLGADWEDQGLCIALDGQDILVGGRTESPLFPTTPGSFQTELQGNRDGFVARFQASGAALSYCTLIGSGSSDEVIALAVASDGSCVAAGSMEGFLGFPDIPGSYVSPTFGGYECFAVRIEPDGADLQYAAILGGSALEYLTDLVLDSFDAAYVVGLTASADLPVSSGSYDQMFDGEYDGFAMKLSPDGSSLEFGTYIGGSDWDWANGCAVNSEGKLNVCGMTRSDDLATTPGAFEEAFRGQADGFALRLNAGATEWDFATYLGGGSSAFPSGADYAHEVTVDSTGAVYLVGSTTIHSFPTTAGAYDFEFPTTMNSPEDLFVTKLSSTGSELVYSTFLGGDDADSFGSAEVGSDGSITVAGSSSSSDFPTSPTAYSSTNAGRMDGVAARLSATGADLEFGTYLGGVEQEYLVDVALAADGSIALVGETVSPDFPTTAGAFDTTYGGGAFSGDGFVSVMSATGSNLIASTFLGGAEFDRVLEIRSVGPDFILAGATASPSFPTTPGAYDTTFNGGLSPGDVFVARIVANCSALVFSTLLGGSQYEFADDLAIAQGGDIVVAGTTASINFPTTPGALDRTFGASAALENRDGFVAKLNSTGSTLLASTFLGDTELDEAHGVTVDGAGRIAVVGWTESVNFPLSPDAFDAVVDVVTQNPGANGDGFLTVLDASLSSLIFGTFVGEDGHDLLTTVAGSPDGSIVVAGESAGTAFLDGGFGRADLYNVMILRIRLARLSGVVTPAAYIGTSGAWFLRNSNTPGSADLTFAYGPGGPFLPISGDWDGDGDDSVGIYHPASGAFFLRNSNGSGAADVVFSFGAGGAGVTPLAGDWNGDGIDTIGLYIASTGVFFLRNSNSSGPADEVFTFGAGGAGIAPIVGDWNGDGSDTIGLYIAGSGTFFLRNANAPGNADLAFSYGPAGATPVTGDWNGNGADTIGIYVPASGAWFLRNSNSPGNADLVFTYGPAGATPIVGNWDGI